MKLSPFSLALTFIVFIIIVLFLLPMKGFAQSQRNPCYNTGTNNCIGVGTSNPLPTGVYSNGVTAAVEPANTQAVIADPSLVVQLNPNSPGIIAQGQTTKASSIPVTIASDQYADPCAAGVAKSSAVINITSATTTALVAVSGSTVVYVCGFSATIAPSATSADTLQFEYGTGIACASGPIALTGTFGNGDLTTSAPPLSMSYGNGASTIFKTASSNGLCAVTAGTTVNVQGVVTYVQQ